MADRARCIWLIRKAGPESVPDIRIPKWLRKLLRWPRRAGEPAPTPLQVPPSSIDPLTRLDKLGQLRGNVLTEQQFVAQRERILADPTIGAFGAADGVDPLDRLTTVGRLEAQEVLTGEQAARLTEQILDAS